MENTDEKWLRTLYEHSSRCLSADTATLLYEYSRRLLEEGTIATWESLEVDVRAYGTNLRFRVPVSQLPEAWANLVHIYCLDDYGFSMGFTPKPGSIVVDAGAYLGFYTIYAAAMASTNGVVVAIEPNPYARRILYENIELNGFEDIVHVDPRALYGVDELLATLYIPCYWANASLYKEYKLLGDTGLCGKIPIRTVSLEHLMEDHELDSITLLKMDIEGAEEGVIAASRSLLRRGIIEKIVVEVHEQISSLRRLASILKDTGYSVESKRITQSQTILYAFKGRRPLHKRGIAMKLEESFKNSQLVKARYKLLARTGMLRLLAVLYEHGAMPIYKVSRYGIGMGAAYRGVEEAKTLRLVREVECNTTKCIELTEKGRRVAEHLVRFLDSLDKEIQDS